jgi:uncharacterized membrane protein (DUF4010 family)
VGDESPVSVKRVVTFAALFLVIQVVSALGQRYFGKVGFLAVSVLAQARPLPPR